MLPTLRLRELSFTAFCSNREREIVDARFDKLMELLRRKRVKDTCVLPKFLRELWCSSFR